MGTGSFCWLFLIWWVLIHRFAIQYLLVLFFCFSSIGQDISNNLSHLAKHGCIASKTMTRFIQITCGNVYFYMHIKILFELEVYLITSTHSKYLRSKITVKVAWRWHCRLTAEESSVQFSVVPVLLLWNMYDLHETFMI